MSANESAQAASLSGTAKFTDFLDAVRVQAISLEPDDLLVIEARKTLGPDEQLRLRDLLHQQLPGARVLVLDSDLALRAVLRQPPDAPDHAWVKFDSVGP